MAAQEWGSKSAPRGGAFFRHHNEIDGRVREGPSTQPRASESRLLFARRLSALARSDPHLRGLDDAAAGVLLHFLGIRLAFVALLVVGQAFVGLLVR